MDLKRNSPIVNPTSAVCPFGKTDARDFSITRLECISDIIKLHDGDINWKSEVNVAEFVQ